MKLVVTRCPVCGGELELDEKVTQIECSYCGNTVRVLHEEATKKASDEKKLLPPEKTDTPQPAPAARKPINTNADVEKALAHYKTGIQKNIKSANYVAARLLSKKALKLKPNDVDVNLALYQSWIGEEMVRIKKALETEEKTVKLGTWFAGLGGKNRKNAENKVVKLLSGDRKLEMEQLQRQLKQAYEKLLEVKKEHTQGKATYLLCMVGVYMSALSLVIAPFIWGWAGVKTSVIALLVFGIAAFIEIKIKDKALLKRSGPYRKRYVAAFQDIVQVDEKMLAFK